MAGRVLIIGAGAIGGVLGGLLSRAGVEVVFLARPEAAEKMNAEGLSVIGVRGSFTARPRAVSAVSGLSGAFDAVMAAVKTYDLSGALAPVLPVLSRDCPVVSLQNGICLDELEGLAGRERAVGCVVGWGATLHGPASVELTSEGEMVIGSRASAGADAARIGDAGRGDDGGTVPALDPVRRILSLAFPTSISADILADLYSKLIINSCITTLGAVSGRTLGWMLGRRLYRAVFIGIIREAMAAADAAGIRVPPYAGRLDYYAFLRGGGAVDDIRRHLFIRLMGVKYRRLKSSSLQSLERGKPTEVDSFNGYISRLARAHGIPTPLNDALTAMVHEIETGKRPITPANFTPALLEARV